MRKESLLSILLCAIACPAAIGAQTEDFASYAQKLASLIHPVTTAAKTYEATLTTVQPGVLRYSYDEVDQKGNKISYAYEFNLADMDPYAVREQAQKDLMQTMLAVRDQQKLVKVTKNGEAQSYDKGVNLLAVNIENAREISDLIKKAIPAAEAATKSRLNLSGYDAMVDWLTQHIVEVTLDKKSVAQKLVKGAQPGALVLTQTESDGKSATEEQYSFNLGDINLHTLAYEISGSKFGLTVEIANKQKYIGMTKNQELRPFVNELTIHANSVDEARDVKTVITYLVPLAVEKIKVDMPKLASSQAVLDRIKASLVGVDLGARQISQSMEAACLTKLTQEEKDAKKTEQSLSEFNWMDINPLASAIKVSGVRMSLQLITEGKAPLVRNTVDSDMKGYGEEVEISAANIETARRLKGLMEQAVERCKAAYKEPFGTGAPAILSWMKANIGDHVVDQVSLKQSLDQVEGDANRVKYTRTEITPKGGTEEIYEFLVNELNGLSVRTDAKGKWLYVTVETQFKNKIVKYYKDGKIMPYLSKVEFAVNDIEGARNLSRGLDTLLKKPGAK